MTDTDTPAKALIKEALSLSMSMFPSKESLSSTRESLFDDALRTARNEALEDAAQLVFPDISFSQGLEVATAIRALKS
jgi:hypothetical protein